MKIEDQVSFTFDDVLIKPQFSEIQSRKDVDLSTKLLGLNLRLPIFSANMDTVTGIEMAHAMNKAGGMGVLHRFWSIEDNVKAFKETAAAVSVGLGPQELERAKALTDAGAIYFFIDVAHGATKQVVVQLANIKMINVNAWVCVGNFASASSIGWFLEYCHGAKVKPDAIKVGVGPGSACTTRIKTGIGVPQLSAVIECANEAGYIPIIADGGLKTPGDIAKALAAGASAVMVGGMIAGTDETPGEVFFELARPWSPELQALNKMTVTSPYGPMPIHIEMPLDGGVLKFKKYRGSASKESYEAQGKDTAWRTAEGESFTVPCKGPVSNVLQDIKGGLRSSLTYVGAKNLTEFREKVVFVRVSPASIKENSAHGKS